MGCMIERDADDDDDDDDEVSVSNNKSDRRVYPFKNQCNLCHCQQFSQRKINFNQCWCGHLLKQHKHYSK
jgi:hypothetical protein